MAYTKLVWKDLPSIETPFSAYNMNHIEDGVEANDLAITNLTATSGVTTDQKWTKFADGTLIVVGYTTIDPSLGTSETIGSTVWYKNSFTVTFSQTFIATPIITTSANSTIPYGVSTSYSSGSTTGCLVWLGRYSTAATGVAWKAIGRWKN